VKHEMPRETRDARAALFLKKFDGIIDHFDEEDYDEYEDNKYYEYNDDYNEYDDKYGNGFPPTPPPAPGEHGHQQVGSSPCLCPTNTRRALSEAVSNITPSPTVHDRPDCGGRARTRAHRRAMRPAGAGTKVEATPLVSPTTITRGNTGFRSPPPDSSRATMAPSQATTALPLSLSLLSPEEDEVVEPNGTPPPPPDPAVNDGGS
jgi:hypothetical protein